MSTKVTIIRCLMSEAGVLSHDVNSHLHILEPLESSGRKLAAAEPFSLRTLLPLLLLVVSRIVSSRGHVPSRGHHVRCGPAGLFLVSGLVEDDGKSLGGCRVVHIPLPEFGQWPTCLRN